MSATSLFTLLHFIYLASCALSQELCPKDCSICFNDHLSCTSGGLQSFPPSMLESTTKITLIGHTFDNPVLSRANFSRFAKPKYSIEQLSIRQSNIDTILFNTFFDLSGLDNLDLSDNRKMEIQSKAFSNLKLKHLKLDQIHTLILHKDAFEGLMVASLSMKHSRLKTLSFDLLLPISTNLRNLFLSNNELSYLEPKFEHLFQQLSRLDLTGNPFQCSCDLAWLGRVILYRVSRIEGSDGSFSNSGFNSNYPICVGPLHVRNRLIHNISESEFSCTPPSLEIIDLKFENNGLVKLRCSAKMSVKSAPVQVIWQQLPDSSDSMNYPDFVNAEFNQAVTMVKRSSQTNFYRCLAISNSGNATVKITITWPPLLNDTVTSDDTRSDWFDKQKKQSEKSFFFKEQFTLLEMLGAVMGTFTVTLTAFLLLYRFCFRVSNKAKKTNSINKSGYSVYEPTAVYNDSLTYDVPQNNYSIASQTFVNKTLPKNPASHYIDYRTQQLISHH